MTRRSPISLVTHIGRRCGRPVHICCMVLVQVPYNAPSDVRAVRTFRNVAAFVAAEAVVAANTGGDVAARAVGVVAARAVVAAAAAAAVVVVVTADTAVVEAVVAVASNATAAGDGVCRRTCRHVSQVLHHDHLCRYDDLPIPLVDLLDCA